MIAIVSSHITRKYWCEYIRMLCIRLYCILDYNVRHILYFIIGDGVWCGSWIHSDSQRLDAERFCRRHRMLGLDCFFLDCGHCRYGVAT